MLAAVRLADADDRSERRRAQRNRMRLYALDWLLEDLERLNEFDVAQVPSELEERLERAGIQCPPGITVTHLIERVFERQERFMRPGRNGLVTREEKQSPRPSARGLVQHR